MVTSSVMTELMVISDTSPAGSTSPGERVSTLMP